MKFMFASDIHGSAYYCRKLMEAMEKNSRKNFCCWGICCTTDPEMIFQENMRPKR